MITPSTVLLHRYVDLKTRDGPSGKSYRRLPGASVFCTKKQTAKALGASMLIAMVVFFRERQKELRVLGAAITGCAVASKSKCVFLG